MLSDGALNDLRHLAFDPDAERLSWMIPTGGIYWDNEIPDFDALILGVPKTDRELIFRLFGIRFKLWAGDALSSDDQSYWDTAQKFVPEYLVFHRIKISDYDRAAQAAAEEDAIASFEALLGDADHRTVDDDGRFSAAFDLTKDQLKSLGNGFSRDAVSHS